MTDVLISLLKGKIMDKISLLKEGYTVEDLCNIEDSFLKSRYNLEKGIRFKDFKEISNTIKKLKIKTLNILDSDYPERLKAIYNPPFLLFLRGNVDAINQELVSIVGTRKPSLKGYYGSFQLGLDFGKSSIGVVSGLALGIDASAHEGNIVGKGKTVAVLGNGIDSIYPKANVKLAAKVLTSGGLIISEYPPGEIAKPYNFPKRNRIIAGLSTNLIIVQAPKKSGSLITGDMALDNGCDVYVHSSGIGDRKFLGSDIYHNDGAKIIDRGYPIIKFLNKDYEIDTFNQDDFSEIQLLEMELNRDIYKYRGKYFYL